MHEQHLGQIAFSVCIVTRVTQHTYALRIGLRPEHTSRDCDNMKDLVAIESIPADQVNREIKQWIMTGIEVTQMKSFV